jgi:hypothetical protein
MSIGTSRLSAGPPIPHCPRRRPRTAPITRGGLASVSDRPTPATRLSGSGRSADRRTELVIADAQQVGRGRAVRLECVQLKPNVWFAKNDRARVGVIHRAPVRRRTRARQCRVAAAPATNCTL